jgi:hypothetical protein
LARAADTLVRLYNRPDNDLRVFPLIVETFVRCADAPAP